MLRWGYVREEPEQTLSRIAVIPEEKRAVLDLALAYYKLSYYKNPVRIQTLFSCISVIIRNLTGNDYLETPALKNQIRSILIHQNPNLDCTEFQRNWNDCYSIERNYIAHGKESKLVDIANLRDHDRLAGIVGSWARQIIYYYINDFQTG